MIKLRTQINFKLNAAARDVNWHNVIGFWCAPVLLVISLTGIIMSYSWASDMLFRISGNPVPVMRQEGGFQSHRPHAGDDSTVDLDALFAKAKQQDPDWKAITLRLSGHGGSSAVFNIQEAQAGHRSQLTLSSSAQVVKWEPYSGQNLGRKLRILTKFLHTGEALGWPGQTLAFLASMGLIILVWTGFAKAYRRFFYRIFKK